LKKVCWPLNFKPLEIEKYDGSTNLAEWLKMYQLTIKATGGDLYVMDNYLTSCLSSLVRTWLMGLSTSSVCSWSDLCQKFISDFRATCVRPGVDWDLANMVQKKGESLWEFIQHFCNKSNIIPQVDDKPIIMFFKKELRDLSLICKLTMKNRKTSEEMLAIANKYTLAEEASLDTREQKKDKELDHSVQPNTSKSHDKKRKVDFS
jgi:hypothetical protein